MSTSWLTVRAFISSTFRDMQAERDWLVRFVFPRLREELVKYRIHFVDVDLRWGVTGDQDALGVCREIIDECRPRFLCMLGGRYGWVPEGRDESITADEVHYGVLGREAEKRSYAFFYFRNEADTLGIPEADSRLGGYREFAQPGEIERHGAQRAEAMARERASKLDALKKAIIVAGLPVFLYRAEWNAHQQRLTGLEAFGNQVYADLLQSLKDDPKLATRFAGEGTSPPDEFADEAEQMEAFIEERTDHYIIGSREPLLRDMLAFAATDGTQNIFVLTGDPGSGKSALLAKLTRDLAELHPSPLFFPHFIGASAGSTDLRRTLRRLCHELARVAGNTEPLPLDIKDLITHFQKLLAEAAGRQRVILVFDALNQFDATDGAHWLNWLPRELPPGVRIVASVIAPAEGQPEHQTLAILRGRPATRIEKLEPLTEADTLAVIEGCLRRYAKRLGPEQLAALLDKPAGRLPLYILTALEELRTLGTYEEITDRIRTLPGEARALFGWILTERLARDPGFRDREERLCGAALVEKFAACLGVSRHGLSPAELTTLLDPGDPLGNVAALLRLLRPYLMRRGELLDFFHGQFREAAGAAHLDTPEKQLAAHLKLASYFEAEWREGSVHAMIELPYQRTKAEDRAGVERILCDLDFIEAKCGAHMPDGLLDDFALLRNSGSQLSARITDFEAFLHRHAFTLGKDAGLTFQHAANEVPSSAPAKDALQKWEANLELRPWLKLTHQVSRPLRTYLRFRAPRLKAAIFEPERRGLIGLSAAEESNLPTTGASDHRRSKLIRLRDDSMTPEEIGTTSSAGECIAVPPVDNTLLAIGLSDGGVEIWNPKIPALIKEFKHTHGKIGYIAYAPDARMIITLVEVTSTERLAQFTDLDGNLVFQCSKLDHHLRNIPFSQDGSHFFLYTETGDLVTYSYPGFKALSSMNQPRDVLAVAAANDLSTVAVAAAAPFIMLWNYVQGECLGIIDTDEIVSAMAFVDSRNLLIVPLNGNAFLYDTKRKVKVRTYEATAQLLRLSPDATLAIAASPWISGLKVLDVGKSFPINTVNQSNLRGFAVDWESFRMATWFDSPEKGCIVDLSADLRTQSNNHEIPEHSSAIRILELAPDGSAIASSDLHCVMIRETAAAAVPRILIQNPRVVRDICFSLDGTTLFLAADDGLKRIDLASGQLKTNRDGDLFGGVNLMPQAISHHPLVGLLACGSDCGIVYIRDAYDLSTYKLINVSENSLCSLVDYCDDGSKLLHLSNDGRLAIFDFGEDYLEPLKVFHSETTRDTARVLDAHFVDGTNEVVALMPGNVLRKITGAAKSDSIDLNISTSGNAVTFSFLNQCKLIAIAFDDGYVRLLAFPSLKPVAREYVGEPICGLATTRSTDTFAIAYGSGDLRFLTPMQSWIEPQNETC